MEPDLLHTTVGNTSDKKASCRRSFVYSAILMGTAIRKDAGVGQASALTPSTSDPRKV